MQTHTPLEIPPEIWTHSLFLKPAEYPAEKVPLTAARIDAKLRRIRHMPSTDDDTAERALNALEKVYENVRKQPVTSVPEPLFPLLQQYKLVQRLSTAFENGTAGQIELRILDRLCPELVQAGFLSAIPAQDIRIGDLIEQLHTAELLLLDHIAAHHPIMQRSYLKQVYKAVNQSHAFNTTADTVRIDPVIRWIKDIITAQPENTSYSYIDVGCSVETGAKNTLIAAELLQPLCAEIHGVDIVSPSHTLQLDMLRQHHILLYQANTVHHPLPRKYDIILLANVHRHLTRTDQKAILQNLGHSLRENGFLIINWRFDQQNSPALLLQRTARKLNLLEEKNCI